MDGSSDGGGQDDGSKTESVNRGSGMMSDVRAMPYQYSTWGLQYSSTPCSVGLGAQGIWSGSVVYSRYMDVQYIHYIQSSPVQHSMQLRHRGDRDVHSLWPKVEGAKKRWHRCPPDPRTV